MSTLDEFFREKLATNSMMPPEGAWEKVEAGLSKKNKGLGWLRWAAALLVGTLLFGVLWMRRDGAPQLVQEKQQQLEQAPVVKKELPNPQMAETKTVPKQEQAQKKKINREQMKTFVPAPKEESKRELITDNDVAVVKELEEPLNEEKLSTETVPVTEKKSRAIVLTYTLDPVITASEQREENPDANVVAETDKKSKGLKRMIDLANEVKNSESPLGELRLKKSELFALELGKKSPNKQQ